MTRKKAPKAPKLAKRIRVLRVQKSLSPTQLGAECGVSESAVRKWEDGVSTPRDSILPILARTLGVTVAELLA